MDRTAIEWTDSTWNPLVGCSRVSQGCTNCYAERHAYRFSGQAGSVYEGTARMVNGKPTFTGRVNLNPRVLDQPMRWKRPRRIFVNSMSDVFHENVSDDTIDRIFAVMALAQQHTFQILTKRPERMLAYIEADRMGYIEGRAKAMVRAGALTGKTLAGTWPWPNVWLGVSVEDQAAADARIPLLLRTPAAVRFLSCEPLLGPVDVLWSLRHPFEIAAGFLQRGSFSPGAETLRPIDWIIAGGESGPRARPMHPAWARSLRDQCAAARVPFFFKQWGEWEPRDEWTGHLGGGRFEPQMAVMPDGSACGSDVVPQDVGAHRMARVGKKVAGHLLDGVEHHAFPEAA